MCRSKRLSPLPGALLPLGCRERSNEADQDEYRGHQSHSLEPGRVNHKMTPHVIPRSAATAITTITGKYSKLIATRSMFPLILHYTVPM